MPKLAANFSMMFREVDMLDRFALAARAGFTGAEIQSPYEHTAHEIAAAYRESGLEAVLFNLPSMVGAVPGREAEFDEGVARALEYCRAAGCRQVHCLAGVTDDARAEATFVANLRRASAAARPAGVRLLLEPLNTHDMPGYFLTPTADARRIIDRVGEDNVFLQYDVYHMQIMEGDVIRTLTDAAPWIGHYHTGGVPGRAEIDDTQELNYPAIVRAIRDTGFDGYMAHEFIPRSGDPLRSLADAVQMCASA